MLGEEIKKWFIDEGIFKEEISDEKAEWHFLVEFPSNSKQVSDVLKPKNKDIIVVASGIALSEEHYRAMSSLPAKKRNEIIYRWKMDLLFRKAEFRIRAEGGNVQRIEFSIPVYLEEASRGEIMSSLREVFRSKMYIIWSLQHEFEGTSNDIDAMFR